MNHQKVQFHIACAEPAVAEAYLSGEEACLSPYEVTPVPDTPYEPLEGASAGEVLFVVPHEEVTVTSCEP